MIYLNLSRSKCNFTILLLGDQALLDAIRKIQENNELPCQSVDECSSENQNQQSWNERIVAIDEMWKEFRKNLVESYFYRKSLPLTVRDIYFAARGVVKQSSYFRKFILKRFLAFLMFSNLIIINLNKFLYNCYFLIYF